MPPRFCGQSTSTVTPSISNLSPALTADAATVMGTAAPKEVQEVLAARAQADAMAGPQRTMFLPSETSPTNRVAPVDTLEDYPRPVERRMSPLIPAAISIGALLLIAGGVYAWTNRGGLTRVHLQSDPSGAEVFLADRVLGVTPLDTELERLGRFELEFRKSGFLSAKRLLMPRQSEAVQVRLLAAPPPEPEEPKPVEPPPPKPTPKVTSPPAAAKPPVHKPPKRKRPLHDMLLKPSF